MPPLCCVSGWVSSVVQCGDLLQSSARDQHNVRKQEPAEDLIPNTCFTRRCVFFLFAGSGVPIRGRLFN